MRNLRVRYRVVAVLSALFMTAVSHGQITYSETFTAANQSSNSVITADHSWSVLAGTAELSGNAMIGGASQAALLDQVTALSINTSSSTVTIEADLTVTSISGTSAIIFATISPFETGAPRYQAVIGVSATAPSVTLAVSDGTTTDQQSHLTGSGMVAGTTYHLTATFTPNGSSTDCETSLEAVAGPGTDLFVSVTDTLTASINGTAGPYNAYFTVPTNASTFAVDNYTITSSGATIPAMSVAGAMALIAAIGFAGATSLKRSTGEGARDRR